MKIFRLFLVLVGTACIALPVPQALADDTVTVPQTTPSPSGTSGDSDDNGTASGAQGQRLERWKEAMAALNLTDDQKAKIKQIRATVTDRKERRQQIVAVLTPDQKAKLRELIAARRNGN